MIWAVIILGVVAVSQALVTIVLGQTYAAERARLLNHVLAEKPADYAILQRAERAPRDPSGPNKPAKIFPEGI